MSRLRVPQHACPRNGRPQIQGVLDDTCTYDGPLGDHVAPDTPEGHAITRGCEKVRGRDNGDMHRIFCCVGVESGCQHM